MCWPDVSDNSFKHKEISYLDLFNTEESSSLDLFNNKERSLWISSSCYVRGTPLGILGLIRALSLFVYVHICLFTFIMLGDIMFT